MIGGGVESAHRPNDTLGTRNGTVAFWAYTIQIVFFFFASFASFARLNLNI